jgi:hypothetical protein
MKVELVQYPGGKYAVRRTRRNVFGIKFISYLDVITQNNRASVWRSSDNDYLYQCFSTDLNDVIRRYVETGLAPGVIFNAGAGINLGDFTKMAAMAETDEGMKDLLAQAKEYYILKKK